MKCKSGKRAELDLLTGNSLKFDDDAELQSDIRQLCERIGVNFDHNTGWTLWAAIGMRLARDQPEFREPVRKRKGRPRGARKSLSKWLDHDRAFVRFARFESKETGAPVPKLISSAVYGARKFHERGKPPTRDNSQGLWECLKQFYKKDQEYVGLEKRLKRCNDAYDAKSIEELLKQGFAGVALQKTKNDA